MGCTRIYMITALLSTLLLCCVTPSLAYAQSEIDALWDEYGERSDAFVAAQTRCDEGDIEGTTTNRRCSEAVDTGLALAGTIEALITLDATLSDADREMLLDGLLTSRQIAASIQVDLGHCEDARSELITIREHPGTASRPVVSEAAERWILMSEDCIAEAEAAEERARLAAIAEEQRRAADQMAERDQFIAEERARGEAEQLANTDFEPAVDPNRSRLGPILVTATGGLILASAVSYDAAMYATVREFRRERDRCSEGLASCDERAALDAGRRVDNAKPVLATLYAVGGVTAIGGLTWYILAARGDRADRSVTFAPMGTRVDGERFYGARIRARF
jgi:hypothetical protein